MTLKQDRYGTGMGKFIVRLMSLIKLGPKQVNSSRSKRKSTAFAAQPTDAWRTLRDVTAADVQRINHIWKIPCLQYAAALHMSSQAQPCTLARELRQVRFSETFCHGCSEAAHRLSEVLCSSSGSGTAAHTITDTLCHGCSRAAAGGESHEVELSLLSHRKSALLAESLATTLHAVHGSHWHLAIFRPPCCQCRCWRWPLMLLSCGRC